MPTRLSEADWVDFLVAAYFGGGEDLLQACLNRAYRDFNRTLHRIGRDCDPDTVRCSALVILVDEFQTVKKIQDQSRFDQWHKCLCDHLAKIYRRHGYEVFSIGQAQKWVNMTFKYVFALSESRLPGYHGLYDFCHVPFDNILIERLIKHGFEPFDLPWSRIDDYEEYFERQTWIRSKFSGFVPMDVEAFLWMGRELPSK